MQQSLVSMAKELNALAEERIQLIENGHFDILQKVERLSMTMLISLFQDRWLN